MAKESDVVSSTVTDSSSIRTDSNSGWNLDPGRESDTAVLRYNRVAMLEAVLSIRDRQQQTIRRMAILTMLLAGGFVITAGVLGWF